MAALEAIPHSHALRSPQTHAAMRAGSDSCRSETPDVDRAHVQTVGAVVDRGDDNRLAALKSDHLESRAWNPRVEGKLADELAGGGELDELACLVRGFVRRVDRVVVGCE